MKNTAKTVRVHRFNDSVAISFQNAEGEWSDTVYITARRAADLSEALGWAAMDIRSKTFAKSTFNTMEI